MPTKQTTWFFEIPNDLDVWLAIIDAIPNDWGCITGMLTPRPQVINGTDVSPYTAPGTGYLFGVMSTYSIVGIKKAPHEVRHDPDLIAASVKRLAPSFVEFDHAGMMIEDLTSLKTVIQGFVTQGYAGNLLLMYDAGESIDYTAAFCDVHFIAPNAGAIPHVKLCYHPSNGGSVGHVVELLNFFRGLNLREYQPWPVGVMADA